MTTPAWRLSDYIFVPKLVIFHPNITNIILWACHIACIEVASVGTQYCFDLLEHSSGISMLLLKHST